MILQPCWELLVLPGCLLQSRLLASGRSLGFGGLFYLLFPLYPLACAPAILLSPSEGTSAGFGMDFVVLERSSRIPFGFPLNDCIVCLQKKPPSSPIWVPKVAHR